MKTIFTLMLPLTLLTACGTLITGANDKVEITNNSAYTLTATGSMGTIKVPAQSTKTIKNDGDITLTSAGAECNHPVIQTELNTSAVILDIFPGIFFGVIPILIDALAGNITELPYDYEYTCETNI